MFTLMEAVGVVWPLVFIFHQLLKLTITLQGVNMLKSIFYLSFKISVIETGPHSCVFLRVAVSFFVLADIVSSSYTCSIVCFSVCSLALKEVVLAICAGVRVGLN
jgi:hypothetical protein